LSSCCWHYSRSAFLELCAGHDQPKHGCPGYQPESRVRWLSVRLLCGNLLFRAQPFFCISHPGPLSVTFEEMGF
jgi:hypothetical protein